MITEIVLFRLPDGMDRKEAIAKYRLSIPTWQANPDLIRKAFLFDENSRRGGGVYHWKSIEAAKLAHDPDFQKRIQATFGSQPEFQYFETPIVLDNTTKQVVDDAALSFQVFVVGQRAGRCRSDPDISFATLNRIDDYSRNQGKWHSSAEVGFSGSNRRASYRSSTKSPSGSTIPRTKLSGSPK